MEPQDDIERRLRSAEIGSGELLDAVEEALDAGLAELVRGILDYRETNGV